METLDGWMNQEWSHGEISGMETIADLPELTQPDNGLEHGALTLRE